VKVPITQLFKECYGQFALGAFNVFNAEQIWAVMNGINKSRQPAIIQITPTALGYLPYELFKASIDSVSRLVPDALFSLHLDHGQYQDCEKVIHDGYFNSVMIDASHEEFHENIRITKEIVKMAHAKNIAVEAELGVLSGVEDNMDISAESAFYTNPEQVKEFVKQTQCDSLAVAVGTSHGAYKFNGQQGLQLDILNQIKTMVPRFPLVLHGASEVPKGEISRINKAGGDLKESASGLKINEIHAAINSGICKINIATDMRLIWTRVHREFFKANSEKFDMVIPGKEYMTALEDFVAKKCNELILTHKI
jgi:fructose-bisphosphate aldolase class II